MNDLKYKAIEESVFIENIETVLNKCAEEPMVPRICVGEGKDKIYMVNAKLYDSLIRSHKTLLELRSRMAEARKAKKDRDFNESFVHNDEDVDFLRD